MTVGLKQKKKKKTRLSYFEMFHKVNTYKCNTIERIWTLLCNQCNMKSLEWHSCETWQSYRRVWKITNEVWLNNYYLVYFYSLSYYIFIYYSLIHNFLMTFSPPSSCPIFWHATSSKSTASLLSFRTRQASQGYQPNMA